jgi:hypothetical protein
MPERKTHGETLQAGAPITVGALVLVPIERVERHVDIGESGLWFSFEKVPYALVIRDAYGTRAVNVEAVAVSLEELRAKIPGFDALLASA